MATIDKRYIEDNTLITIKVSDFEANIIKNGLIYINESKYSTEETAKIAADIAKKLMEVLHHG